MAAKKSCRAKSTGRFKKCAKTKKSCARAKHPRDPKTGRFVKRCKRVRA